MSEPAPPPGKHTSPRVLLVHTVTFRQARALAPVVLGVGATRGLDDGPTTGSASGTSVPRSTADTCASDRTPNTVIPGTSPASPACGSALGPPGSWSSWAR